MSGKITTQATINAPGRPGLTWHAFFREDEKGSKCVFGGFEHATDDACQLCAWEFADAVLRQHVADYAHDPYDDERFK